MKHKTVGCHSGCMSLCAFPKDQEETQEGNHWSVEEKPVIRKTILVILLTISIAHADVAKTSESIHAVTDIVAALQCQRKGYGYFLRLTSSTVLCLLSNMLAKDAINIHTYIDQQAEQMHEIQKEAFGKK